jgi:hypothetical protein
LGVTSGPDASCADAPGGTRFVRVRPQFLGALAIPPSREHTLIDTRRLSHISEPVPADGVGQHAGWAHLKECIIIHVKTLVATGIAGALAVTTLSMSPAAAYYPPQSWYNDNSSVVDRDTVEIAVAQDGAYGYVYNRNLDYPVQSGDVVSFYMDTQDDTWCTAYYPYVYLEVDGRGFTSYADGTACPGDQASTQDDGYVSFRITETGRVGFAQVFYVDDDQNGVGGTLEISDLRINNEPIYFELDPGPDPEPEPVPVATDFGAALAKNLNRCRIITFAYHDAAQAGQVATPRRRGFVTRVDGVVREVIQLRAGQVDRTAIRVRPQSGKHIATIRTTGGRLLDRMAISTRRC